MGLDVTVQILRLLIADTVFLVVCMMLLIPLKKFKRATFAVLKRNLFGYFSNPTGYVFICLFVLVGSAFAFWPHEFFNSNLATLGELNKTFPLVMLLFIPTITMSIWADERRQGTDELLLTIPATDWDIVLGKYLAVAAIFTVSLVFSQLANFTVLIILARGDIDTGLFATTYVGYWLIGLAMLALGMASSFLTSNLTVGFILGVLFNAPLVMAANSDLIFHSTDVAQMVSRWSYASQFEDFGRGVLSFKSIIFFTMVVAIGLYLSVVLIGRRHWYGGKDGDSMLGHYIARALALVVFACGANLFFASYDLFRIDSTTEQVSSLSDDTKKLIDDLSPKHSILIEAFISRSVPKTYTRTKVDLITMLNEFGAWGGAKLKVKIYDNLEPFSEDASRAELQYGIAAQTVLTQDRGAYKQENIFLAAAFTSGLEKVVVPFFDHGIPVEYELVRSINTVAEAKRPRIGVVRTDAELFGGFDMQQMAPRPRQMIIDELEKQYEVVQVEPNSPIETFDVLMVVQPSSLTPPQLENLIDSIRAGQPTAIFEDPFPIAMRSAPGTGQPKRPRGGGGMMSMMGGGQPPEPKGDITRLWSMLGIEMVGRPGFGGPFDASIIWQRYNPYPKARSFDQFTPEWVFASPDAPGAKPPGDEDAIGAINENNSVTSGLDQLLLLFPGAIRQDESKGMKFEQLVATGNDSGTISFQDIQMSQNNPAYLKSRRRGTGDRFILAAHISGKVKPDGANPADFIDAFSESDSNEGDEDEKKKEEKEEADSGEAEVNVVFVTDIDLLHSQFLAVRARPEGDIDWQFDNIPFVLNILDVLAGDNRLVEIRKRQTRHSTLKMIDAATETARDDFAKSSTDFESKFTQAKEDAEAAMQAAIRQLEDDVEKERTEKGQSADLNAKLIQLAMKQQVAQRRFDATTRRLEQERDRNRKRIEQELNQNILSVQNSYKALAVLLPPIPPLVVGLIVFMRRRQRELEGVIEERRR